MQLTLKKYDRSKEIGDILEKYLANSMKLESINELIDKCDKLESDFSEVKNITNDLKELREKEIKRYITALDVNSLYPSAMSDLNSEYPRMESVRKFNKEEEKEILNKFNTQTFRPKTGIFKILYEYPDDMFSTPIFCKDSVKANDNKIEVLRSSSGQCCDILTSVDIQEIVRCGGK